MSTPTTKAWVSTKRKRNFIAKKLLSEKTFKPKILPDKRKRVILKEDRKNLDEWLLGSTNGTEG